MSDTGSISPDDQDRQEPPLPAVSEQYGEDAADELVDDATLDLDQAATYAGRAAATLRRVVRQGKLPRRYRPGLYGPELIFTRADIDAWLAEQARTVEAMPPVSTLPAVAEDPSTMAVQPVEGDATRLYALVALAYAQRLQAVEEQQREQAQHLAAVEERARAADDAQQRQAAILTGVLVRLAQLEADLQQPQKPRDTQERRGDNPNRRALDLVWSAEERRRTDRRAQEDRERFEENVMSQYVPPAPTAVPHSDKLAPRPSTNAEEERAAGQAVRETHVGQERRRHPSLLARILRRLR